eukprot:357274-Chlamydomonas_euryale.AAC.20
MSVNSYSLIIFIGVYAGVVNNQNLSRFVRYNAAQAGSSLVGSVGRIPIVAEAADSQTLCGEQS